MIIGDMEIRLRADIARLQRDMDQARQVVSNTAGGIERAADQMKAALAGVGLGVGLAQIVQMSDQYTKFTAQLKLATLSQREYAQALADVKRISTDAQSSMAGAGTLYARIANGTRELGVSQQQVANITETVSLALKVSGATAEESASAMLQLSQSFASGTLRGEEFNAVNEAAPRLMKALADGMGVPIGALKEMASNGQITSKIMSDVLPDALAKLREEAKQVQTIGGAFQVLKDRVMEFTAVQAQSNGTVAALTGGIDLLANNLNVLLGVVGTLTAVTVTNWLNAWITKTYERVTAAYAQVAADTATRASAIAAAEAETVRIAAVLARAQADRASLVVTQENVVAQLRAANATLASAQAAVAAASAAGAQSFAIRVLRDANRELAVAETARAALITESAALDRAKLVAQAQLTAATEAQTLAQGRLNVANAAGATTASIASRALGLFGGPLGAIVTLLGLAATAWSMWANRTKEASTQAAESFDEAQARIIKGLDEQIAKNEKLIQLQNGGMSKPQAEKNLPIVKQIEAAEEKLKGMNASMDLAPGQSWSQFFAEKKKVEEGIVELRDKMAKAMATGDAAADGTRQQKLAKWYAENGTAAQRLTAELDKLKKEFGTIPPEMERLVRQKYEDKGSLAALKKEESAYESLMSAIRSKTAENNIELATGKDATESEKTAIKITEELATGKLKLSAAHRAALTAALAEQAESEKALKLQTAQADVTKFIVASTVARNEASKALDVEYGMYGKSADARDMEMVALKSQAETEKKLSDLRTAKLPITDQIISQLKAEEDARTLVGQATLGQTKALQYAASLKTENTKFAAESLADPKARADALLAIDAKVWEERITLAGQGTEAQKVLQDEYNTWYANQSKKILVDVDLTRATELLKIMEAVDDAARQAASGMEDAFGSVGKAIGGLTTALTGYERAQAAVAAQLAAAVQDSKGDTTKIAKANAIASAASAQAQIKSYGDMAGAAKGFFSENSKGYKALEMTERAFRAYEMAMALESMVKKIFFKEGEVAANTALNATKLTGEAATSAVSTGLAATEASAWGITAVVKALASLPFPANIAAGAATLAAVIAIGAKLMGGVGGSSVSVSEQRQAAQGTGSVLGDSSAKSESLSRAIELAAANSSIELTHTSGMLASLKAIENSIGGLGSLLVRGTDVTSLASSVAPTSSGGFFGGIVSSIFGGKTTVDDTGVLINKSTVGQVAAGGLNSQSYVDTTKSGGWFSSDKHNTAISDLGAEVDAQFTKVVAGLAASVTTAADLLGVGGDEFTKHLNSFVVDIGKISLKGMTGDEIQEALEAVFSKLGDDMAQFGVAGLDKFQQVGEGYFETLTRIATDYANLNSIMESIGTAFGATGMASIAARERLIELAGGLDELASQTNSFSENFLSKAEQLAPVQKYVTDQLAAMGLQSLDTRDKFKEYVLGLADSGALATEAGAQQYTALLALADAFAKTHAATVDLTKSEQEIADERSDLQDKLDELTMTEAQLAEKARNAIDSHNQALYDQVVAAQAAKDASATLVTALGTAYSNLSTVISAQKDALNEAYTGASDALQTSIDTATASVTKLTSLSQALQSTLDSMSIPGQEKQQRQDAQAQIEAALAIARAGGPLPDADSLKNALSVVSKDASSQFATALDYQRDLYRTKNTIGALGSLTDAQLSPEQQMLTTLKDQKTALDAAHKAEIAVLDNQLDAAKLQVDLLSGISTSLLTLPDALKALGTAIAGAQSNTTVGTDALTSLYQTLLGRAPDAAGLAYWQKILASGASITNIATAIMNDDEYKALHKTPAFATGGDHLGGARIVGENGPELEVTGPSRIFNANQTRSMLAGDNNEVVAELRAVKAELVEVKAQAKRSADSVELLKRVIRNDRLYTEEA